MTVARGDDDPDEAIEDVELLELVDTDEPQDLGSGLTVDATVARPAPRRKRDTNIPPPRRWRRTGHMGQRICPQCHAIVPGVSEAFWHQQATHGVQSQGDVDLEEWMDDLIAEIEELRAAVHSGAARRRNWRRDGPDHGLSGGHMAAALLAVMVFLFLFGIVYIIATAGR